MLRFSGVGFAAFALVVVIAAAVTGFWAWWVAAALLAGLLVLGVYNLVQRRHSVLRNYPVLGHMRFLLRTPSARP